MKVIFILHSFYWDCLCFCFPDLTLNWYETLPSQTWRIRPKLNSEARPCLLTIALPPNVKCDLFVIHKEGKVPFGSFWIQTAWVNFPTSLGLSFIYKVNIVIVVMIIVWDNISECLEQYLAYQEPLFKYVSLLLLLLSLLPIQRSSWISA